MNEINHKEDPKVSPNGDFDGAYNFKKIEKKWQQIWKDKEVYKVSNSSLKPKCYVLDMFPYPSGAGLHVGHPLGYIASDIYARYKRLKGFNVLHPMGYDSFGLPAEQYALETGQHPAVTTENNIKTFHSQLDNIGFCFDWSREVKTSDPKYYKWTQWIFLQLFNSYFCNTEKKALPISKLIKKYETKGAMPKNVEPIPGKHFTAEQWNAFSKQEQENILMNRRLAYLADGEVNWCEALGTVLANDEVINGVSERGGHPVVKKKMRQWYLRITDYAERLLQGLETVDFSDAMKEMQRNWIGKSEGAEIKFPLIPAFSPGGEGGNYGGDYGGDYGEEVSGREKKGAALVPRYSVASILQFENAKRMRKEYTKAENILWQQLRANQLNAKFRRQHPIDSYIVDFICLQQKLIIEIDGDYHENDEQKELDNERTKTLNEIGFKVIRFTNKEVITSIDSVIEKIKENLKQNGTALVAQVSFSPRGEGRDEGVLVYTTRPDTIFGVDFMVLAPEHELVSQITMPQQKKEIEDYLEYVKSRSERERLAEVKSITGAFTGAYAINPFDGREIPIWISEYVLAGYGTGAIMAVPCGDQRDYNFAKHFNIPITNIIGEHYNGIEANPTKDATLSNSGFLNGLIMKDAMPVVLQKIEEMGIGKRKVNYKMRDAGFSRQRYWGEPFPIIYKDGIAYALDESELPVELPHVENYKPGPEGEGPLANIHSWVDLTPGPSPKERGGATLDYITTDAETWKTLKPFARENRKEQTEAEDILCQNLRNRNISNCKFRRQHAIGGFIVDFVCIEKRLVIEIDGDYHNEDEQKNYDKARTEYLKEQGFNEIRFSNNEVVQNLPNILKEIEKTLTSNLPLLWRGVRGEVKRETNTMPGYAGSSWYFLRYMDPHNDETFADKKATDYWNQVDVYVGGTEHAVGHLLYSRMWTKVLFDLGYISFDEPFKKLLNQGMIQGVSEKIFISGISMEYQKEFKNKNKIFIPIQEGYNIDVDMCIKNENKSHTLTFIIHQATHKLEKYFDEIFYSNTIDYRVNINDVENHFLNIKSFIDSERGLQYRDAIFLCEGGYWFEGKFFKQNNQSEKFSTIPETEKMSKSKYNTVNPNDLIDKYGADTFRMYEMFLGPVEASKPWDTKGIEGIHRFLKKLWRLFYDDIKGKVWNEEKANDAELKVLHKTIKKIEEDTERFAYNTAVSTFMICVNELTDLKCHKKEILQPLLILLTPYAPHIAEELYQSLQSPSPPGERPGEGDFILNASFPTYDPEYLIESEKEYPISINAKMRTTIKISLDASAEEVEKIVLENEVVQKWMEEKPLKKLIYVKNKMINVLV